MSDKAVDAYNYCVRVYNKALLDSSLYSDTKTVNSYIRSREIVRNSILDSNYCAGGRFDYITILRRLGIKQQGY